MGFYVTINIVDLYTEDGVPSYDIEIQTNLPDTETITKVVKDTLKNLEDLQE